MAIKLKLQGVKGSPRTSVTRAEMRGSRPDGSASNRSPGLAWPMLLMGVTGRTFLYTARNHHFPFLHYSTTPMRKYAVRASFLIGVENQTFPFKTERGSG